MERIYQYRINLQLFASDEKTEEATSKRKEEAKKKGQVAKSTDIPQVATLIAGIMIIKILFGFYYKFLYQNLNVYIKDIVKEEFSYELLKEVFTQYLIVFFVLTGPVLLTVLLVGVLSNYVQIGFLFTLTHPSLLLTQILMYGYVVSRLLHAYALGTAKIHDLRALFWSIGSLIILGMSIYTLMFALKG